MSDDLFPRITFLEQQAAASLATYHRDRDNVRAAYLAAFRAGATLQDLADYSGKHPRTIRTLIDTAENDEKLEQQRAEGQTLATRVPTRDDGRAARAHRDRKKPKAEAATNVLAEADTPTLDDVRDQIGIVTDRGYATGVDGEVYEHTTTGVELVCAWWDTAGDETTDEYDDVSGFIPDDVGSLAAPF
ncbi:hypothetical protein [Nocardioides sp. HB32]